MLNFCYRRSLQEGEIIERPQSYFGAVAFGVIMGTLAFVLSRFIRPTSGEVLEAMQELSIWAVAGALSWCAITMLFYRFAQRARLREEQVRKISIVQRDP